MTIPTDDAINAVANKLREMVQNTALSVEDICHIAEAASRLAEADKMVSGHGLTELNFEPCQKFSFLRRKASMKEVKTS